MSQPIRVLFVYDNEAALAVRSGMLASYSEIEVIPTTAVSTALELIDEGGIDCVLSGYALAGSDGISLVRAVRQIDPILPFILFADGVSTTLLEAAFLAGVTDYTPVSVCQTSYDHLVKRIQDSTQQPQQNQLTSTS